MIIPAKKNILKNNIKDFFIEFNEPNYLKYQKL